MIYTSLNQFRSGLLEAGYPADKSAAASEILYAYYQHARGQSDLILGRLDDIKSLVPKFGTAFEGGKGALLITPGGYSDEMSKKQGGKWSIWLNDTFILGGIHSHAVFYLKSTNPGALDCVDDKNEFVFNVTQREIIGLVTFGYSPTGRTTPKGFEYKCSNAALADSAAFRAYCRQIEELTTALRH